MKTRVAGRMMQICISLTNENTCVWQVVGSPVGPEGSGEDADHERDRVLRQLLAAARVADLRYDQTLALPRELDCARVHHDRGLRQQRSKPHPLLHLQPELQEELSCRCRWCHGFLLLLLLILLSSLSSALYFCYRHHHHQ